ncbi:hypothetical protein vseg_011983 [Gypsophila vaccaria]
MWVFGRKSGSGYTGYSTAEEVTHRIDASAVTAIVTGASSGIGAETSRVLALRGVHVVMGVRNIDAGIQVKEQIVHEIPAADVHVMELDLSSMASVRKFASEFKSSGRPLNLLINNAGVMATPFMLSADDIELQFATNYLGHFLLTHLLLDTMRKTSLESGKEGRIVNVSSEAHRFAYSEGVRFDKLNDPASYQSWRAYGQSKLAIILHAKELAKKLKDEGVNVTACSLHPGGINTKLFRHSSFFDGLFRKIGQYVLKSIPQGAATTCYVALHPQVNGVSGEYFSNCNLAKPMAQAGDTALARELWDFTMNLIEPKPSESFKPEV